MKKVISLITCIAMLMAFAVPVFAEGLTVTATKDPSEAVKPGDSVTITLHVTADSVKSGSAAVTLSDKVTVTSGTVSVPGSMLASYDSSKNKAAYNFMAASAVDTDYLVLLVQVADDATADQTVTIESVVKLADKSELKETTVVTIAVDVPHVHDADPAYTPEVPATCSSTGTEAYYTCTGCGKLFKDAACTQEIEAPVTIPMTEHTWDGGTETTPATCSAEGVMTYECTVCHTTKTEPIDKLAHTPEDIPAVAPTCTEAGKTAGVKCSVCGEIITAPTDVEALGHDWNAGEVTTPATETEDGVMTYTCNRCGDTKTEVIPKLVCDHASLTPTAAVEATCTAEGNIAYWTCDNCGRIFSDAEATTEITLAETVIEKIAHTPAEAVKENEVAATCTAEGSYDEVVYCSVCGTEISRTAKTIEKTAHTWGEWTVTKEATYDEEGSREHTCSVCGTKETEVIPKKTHSSGKDKDTTPAVELVTYKDQFKDVSKDDYFYEPVKWAFEKEITAGVTEDLFGVGQGCTRAHVVTFLWAAAGKMEVSTEVPFADVAKDAYYAKAVAWAYSKGITAGTSADAFSPDLTITRAQAITMLWVYMGCPEAVEAATFTDVPADAYYAKAVAWALEKGVTAGKTATTFAPNDTCTREQIVTFLAIGSN